MTEQTLREIYLKSFRIMAEQYGAAAVMSSDNRIGAVWTGGSEAMLTGVLRDEWGFQGAVDVVAAVLFALALWGLMRDRKLRKELNG